MAVGMSTTLRNNRMDEITAFAGNGALMRLYDGTRPATGAAITSQVMLAEFTMGTPFAAAAASGGINITVPSPATGVAAGTCTWARIVQSNGTTFVMDLSAGTDFTLSTPTVSIGLSISVTGTPSFTDGNA